MKKSTVITGGVLIGIILTALILLMTKNDQPIPVPKDKLKSPESASIKPTNAVSVAATLQSQTIYDKSRQKSSAVQQYEQSVNKKDFYDAYKNSTVPGEQFLAYKAYNDCRAFTTSQRTLEEYKAAVKKLEETTPKEVFNQQPSAAAFKKLYLVGCEGFIGKPNIAQEVNTVLKEVMKRGELPLGLSARLNNELKKDTPDSNFAGSLISEALKYENPYVVLETLTAFTGYASSGDLLIDGKPVNPNDATMVGNALQFLGCDLGNICGPNDRLALGLCFEKNECGLSVEQLLQRLSLSPAEYERASQLRDLLLNQFSKGNYSVISVRKK